MLQALGARVLDARGEPVALGGAGLGDVATMDLTGLQPALTLATTRPDGAALTLAADVDNPLTGSASRSSRWPGAAC
jgi:glycerate kinase